MDKQFHTVNKLSFDFRFNRNDGTYQFMERIKAVYYSQIIEIFDEVLSEYCNNDEYFFFDLIEIDLGSISLPDFDKYFLINLKSRLKKIFSSKIEKAFESSHQKTKVNSTVLPEYYESENLKTKYLSGTDYKINLLKYFAMNSSLPWWADSSRVNFDEVVSELIKAEPVKTKNLFLELLRDKSITERIVKQSSADSINKIIQLVEPVKHYKINLFLADLVSIAEASGKIKIPLSKFKVIIYRNIFTSFAREDLSTVFFPTVLKNLITDAAISSNISVNNLLEFIFETVRESALQNKKFESGIIEHLNVLKAGNNLELPGEEKSLSISDKEKELIIGGDSIPEISSDNQDAILDEIFTPKKTHKKTLQLENVKDTIKSETKKEINFPVSKENTAQPARNKNILQLKPDEENKSPGLNSITTQPTPDNKNITKNSNEEKKYLERERHPIQLYRDKNIIQKEPNKELKNFEKENQIKLSTSDKNTKHFKPSKETKTQDFDNKSMLPDKTSRQKSKEQKINSKQEKLTTQPTPGGKTSHSMQFEKKLNGVEQYPITDENLDNIKDIIPSIEGELDEERIYISNAGLVLLNPYLNNFFDRCGLLSKTGFINIDAQIKAAHLLQFIISQSEENPEYLLPLNKILCGLDLSYPVERKIKLTSNDKDECLALVQAVITNWDKLKKTSVEGFISSFLTREGIISFEADETLLRVEKKAYDIILETLPWSFHLIKFSWMKKLLKVEW